MILGWSCPVALPGNGVCIIWNVESGIRSEQVFRGGALVAVDPSVPADGLRALNSSAAKFLCGMYLATVTAQREGRKSIGDRSSAGVGRAKSVELSSSGGGRSVPCCQCDFHC